MRFIIFSCFFYAFSAFGSFLDEIGQLTAKELTRQLREEERQPNRTYPNKIHDATLKTYDIPKRQANLIYDIQQPCISPRGDWIAYISNRTLYIVPTINKSKSAIVLNEKSIGNLHFTTTGFLTFPSKNSVKIIELKNGDTWTLYLPEKATPVRIVGSKENNIIVLSTAQNGYHLYRIDIKKGTSQDITDQPIIKNGSSQPTILFDKKMDLVLIRDNKNIFVIDQKGKKALVEQAVNNDQYISLSNGVCCKFSKNKNGNISLIFWDLKRSQKKEALLPADRFSDCSVAFDANGIPQFVGIKSTKTNFFLPNSEVAKKSLTRLRNSLGGKFFYIIDTTHDKKIWLICVVDSHNQKECYIYDVRNGSLKSIRTKMP
ncbi:MAG: hypothetical protein LBF57_01910 [Holosporaceae bacterium]|jgi:hypothetical protein|nr:hypothetical protein [Holosporaceae bacterium]